VRCFNVGIGIAAGFTAAETMEWVGAAARTSPRELLAVALACLAYFLVDYVASGVSIAFERRSPVRRELWQLSGLRALGLFLAVASLGYLAALVVRALPGWASALLAVPLVAILVATRALSRGNEHRRRLVVLFEAAAAAQGVRAPAEVTGLLRAHTAALALGDGAAVRPGPPERGEIGARVRTGDADLWLVADGHDRPHAAAEADRQALEALATVGEEAYARLRLVDEMGRLARHDSLTGLPNRTLFLDRVGRAVARAQRQHHRIAVLFLDLDGFKAVNDRFGHAAGDELLNTVAARLVACVRDTDSVARLGGDEFAILVEDFRSRAEVDVLCRRVLGAMRAEIVVAGHEVVVGSSIGVAVAGPDDDAPALLRNADMAMYRAKALGKDRFFLYQPSLREEKIRRLELIEALRTGIAGELVVHYQPVVDLQRQRIDGMEALVRWQQDGRLLPPDEFIPAAEESGLIVELGERVLAQVVRDAAVLVAAAGRPLNLGVNMSAHQLREPAFVRQVGRATGALGGSRLVLEMTETVLVRDDVETGAALRALKAAGAALAIDDFGVGFSSIGYLQHLPVDIIKIDRSFTKEIDREPRAAALLDAILVMAQALGLATVAEGIEREAQAGLLRQAGCHAGQGYLFGRPQPLGECLATLRAGPRRRGGLLEAAVGGGGQRPR
jgi:diguanylate cyclase (GGDEF)-like protein